MNTFGKFQNVIHVQPIDGKDADDKIQKRLRKHPHKQSVLYGSFRVLLSSMKLMGLYFDREPTSQDIDQLDFDATSVARWRPTGTYAYSCIVLLAIWINWFRLFTTFSSADVIGTELFFKFLGVVWVALCTVQATVMFRGSLRYSSGFGGLFVRWSAIQKAYCGGEPAELAYISRRVKTFTAVSWIVAILHFSVVAYCCYELDFLDVLITPVSRSDPRANVFIGLFLVVHMYVTCACTHPVALLFVLCVMIYKEYMNLRSALCKAVDKRGRFHGDFEYFRKWHHAVCELTDHVDDIISIMTAAILISCILFICLILYALIWFHRVIKENILVFLIYIFWLVMSLVIILIAAIGGAMVNHAAHSPYNIVHSLDLNTVTTETYYKISIFLNRLSGSNIGITALKLFVIDKPSILTILGMLITYFVVMIQFTPEEQKPTNCTELIYNDTLQCYYM